MKIQVQFDGPWIFDGKQEWVASLPQMPGMVCSGETKKEAFEQLMISLKVKIAYDNEIDISIPTKKSS